MPREGYGPFGPLDLHSSAVQEGVRLVIHAAFDDSATLDREGLLLLAGFVADDAGWSALCAEWLQILSRHDMRRLHTSDFLSGGGEYRSQKFPRPKRLEILHEFTATIRKNVLLAVAVGVDAPEYRNWIRLQSQSVPQRLQKAFHKVLRERLPPVEFCLHRIVKRTVEHARAQWPEGALPISIAFDESPESMRFHAAIRKLKQRYVEVRETVAAIGFQDDRWFAPVQAADLLACVTSREFRKGDDGWKTAPERALFFTDASGHPDYWVISELWNKETLAAAKWD